VEQVYKYFCYFPFKYDHSGGVMILKRADIKKLGVSKIFIWSLNITYQKSKKSMYPATKNLNFPHFVWKQTKSLKTSNKLSFNSVG
jgi:hypothetical protein